MPGEVSTLKKRERRVTEFLAMGDRIEYGLTYEVMVERGLKVWLKAGAVSSVRAEESTVDAWKRVKQWVDGRMDELIDDHTPSK